TLHAILFTWKCVSVPMSPNSPLVSILTPFTHMSIVCLSAHILHSLPAISQCHVCSFLLCSSRNFSYAFPPT
ncbi:hypothetical protein PFISCL1PPCAC_9277, partial [Pristionchus fissidentatus]